MTGERLRALLVDDEPPARRKLRRFLDREPDVEVVGEVGDGPAAVAAIRELEPDLVFLDIQMPGADGFEVIEALGAARPHLIFVTAHHEHAVRAFEVEALDYLLKPFDEPRFRSALERARQRMRGREPGLPGEALRRLLEAARGGTGQPILVKKDDRSFFVRQDEIDWVEAADNYVKLHTGRGAHLVRGTLGGMEDRLDPSRFVRVNRSAIVNLDRVAELRPWSHGDQIIVLEDGTELTLSRRYRKRLPELFDPEF
ncbi:MAG: response regulator transcription factor [Gemmatimonadetes bacterium]|uniref:Response regulator transcription factor n=1 Tax=Candidatus Kutchimonas denitrificans TaxID=3056748 RepID=A0AAE5C881_9BACT|nr:response regulator transcription factor [Gemmatimonadota bacterium]NIR74251.1 response regulator transcription factor [Candidatus Kutchimonas denitrificans]NIS00805.1 response regulator transcription factor [Gemmatimonadota bacterium]NIT66424.1 response regulator transcription factor [Gemmatimonadota bacterium]NIU51834.1 response regulator [Gemmatimonadota bacterium]